MELKLQPKKSRTCWAHCISMVTEVPVETILEMAGHKHGAKLKEVAAIMNKLGYPKASRIYRPFFYEKELPPVCFICLNWKKRGAHLVVYNRGKIYCPGIGIYDYNLKNIDKQEVKAKYYMQIGDRVPPLSDNISHLNCEPEALKDPAFVNAINDLAEKAHKKGFNL